MKPKLRAAPQRLIKPTLRQKGDVVEPAKVLQLIAAVGVSRASRALGVSTTTLHKARKPGAKVSKVIEVGAAGVLRDIGGSDLARDAGLALSALVQPTRDTVAFLLEVEASKRPVVERFSQLVGGKLIAA